jgi:hypothetical protein
MPLCDVIVDLVVADIVRELRNRNAVDGAGKRPADGVEDQECKPSHTTPTTAPTVDTSTG